MGDAADDLFSHLFDRYDDEDGCDEDRGTICKRCGATRLFWGKFRGEWVLRNPDTTDHVCAPSIEGFTNLGK